MSKSIPSISKFMTPSPHSIGDDQTLAKAEAMMAEHGIRHLPVLKSGKLTGIVTDRDIKFLKGFKDVQPDQMKILEFSNPDVFTVEPHSSLDEVCDLMADKKFGCAVVMDNHKLVGIFTWIDALRAMSELLKTRLAK
ncbi:MAG: CBS domain-containing protein [Bdellovibrionales bacterium]|nr:CBS domain-containing protein [Bdellovibrionales bacterium]